MMEENYIDIRVLFDDEDFTSMFDVYLSERPPILVAEELYERISVPGRVEGELTRSIGYASKSFDLFFRFIDDFNLSEKARQIVNWVSNKKKIHFSHDESVYRIIQEINFSNMINTANVKADFMLTLKTEPFWYFDAGVTRFESAGSVTNPSDISVNAKMRVFGTGNCRVLLNENQMEFFSVDEYVDIEERNAHKFGVPKNNDMKGQYPILIPGLNNISLSGATTAVEIDLRWSYR